jgi:NADPH:quinone reductase-like Zn-dependent oxidoreductase
VRAALIRAVGSELELVGDHAEPEGELVVDVTAAPLNPVDLSIAAGRYYVGPPNAPYVPGVEGVGRTSAGGRFWFETGAGYLGDGSMAERAAVHPDRAVELPEAVEDATAGCLGVAGIAAWVPLAHRAEVQEGETVLILGATGVVGQIGVQAARLLGAGRVIAAGRDADRLAAIDADAHVQLPATADDLREAAGGLIDVVLDPLWGEHAQTATEAMNMNGRLVMLGQAAGQEATLDAGVVRGKTLRILGHANAATPPDVKYAAFRTMCEHAAAGRLAVDYEEIPLDRVSEAWERQASSPHVKLIVVP